MGNQPPEQPKPDRVKEGAPAAPDVRKPDELKRDGLKREHDAAKEKETDESFMKRYDMMRQMDLEMDPKDRTKYREAFNRVQEKKTKRERSERTKSFRTMEKAGKITKIDTAVPYIARESMSIFSRRGAILGPLEEGAHVRILKPYTRILPLSGDILDNLGIDASSKGELDDWVYIEAVSKPRNKFQKEYKYRGWVSMSVLQKDPLSAPEKKVEAPAKKAEAPIKRVETPKPPEAPKVVVPKPLEKPQPKAQEKEEPKKEEPITPEMVALVRDTYRVAGLWPDERQSSLSEMVYDLMVASRVPAPKIPLMHAKVTPSVLAYIDSAAVSKGMIEGGREYRLTSENKKVLIKIVRDILKLEKPRWM